jgi:hypothetical protein
MLSSRCVAQSAPPVANTYTQQIHPNTVYGAGASAIAYLTLQTGTNVGDVYIQFSLADIPAEANIQKATLQLYVNQVLGPGTFDVYQLNSAWSRPTDRQRLRQPLKALENQPHPLRRPRPDTPQGRSPRWCFLAE